MPDVLTLARQYADSSDSAGRARYELQKAIDIRESFFEQLVSALKLEDISESIAIELGSGKTLFCSWDGETFEEVAIVQNLVNFNPVNGVSAENMIDKFGINQLCIIRTYSAGVHFGEVADRAGTEVLLKNARRIHYWTGAFTLNAIALNGAGEESRLSDSVPEILLTEAIEVIPCSEAGAKWLLEKKSHEIN